MLNIDSPNYVDIHRTVTFDAKKFTMLCPAMLVTERKTTIDNQRTIPITTESTVDIKAMINCGAKGDFISPRTQSKRKDTNRGNCPQRIS